MLRSDMNVVVYGSKAPWARRNRWVALHAALVAMTVVVAWHAAPALGQGACNSDAECDDADVCNGAETCDLTTNTCLPGTPIFCDPGLLCDPASGQCVECLVEQLCPPVDVVFVMDTSGSMHNEGIALCSSILGVVADLKAQGITVNPDFLGITLTNNPGNNFPCLTDNVLNLLGPDIPGTDTCPWPVDPTENQDEAWGPATAIVADRFPWSVGAIRVIVPLSDEGPCDGNPCQDPGADRDSITNAVAIAGANNVIVSPITANGSNACVLALAADLAAGTGGVTVQSTDPQADLAAAIATIIFDACTASDQCDDADLCTINDTCISGTCVGTPVTCPPGEACDPATGVCVPTGCASDADCNDPALPHCDIAGGNCVECVIDAHCNDGVFCNGAETCDALNTCQPGGGDPCIDPALPVCDEVDDTCVECLADADCANHPNGPFCDVGPDVCVECLTAADCDDTDVCTDDACNAGACVHTFNTAPCDDGLFCTTADACANGACVGGASPCTDPALPVCDEPDDACVECLTDTDCGDPLQPFCDVGPDVCVECLTAADCDDTDVCTDDACNAGACVHTFNTAPCDDGFFCTAPDACLNGACVGGTTPCIDPALPVCDEADDACVECLTDADCVGNPSGPVCNVGPDVCVGCLVDADCDDADVCTDDACTAGACTHTFNTAPCDDGLFCTTADACVSGACVGGTTPCIDPALPVCDEADDQCVECLADADCVGHPNGPFCDVGPDVCVECLIDAHCDDTNVCTDDACVANACVHTFNTAPCDDGDICTELDVCTDGVCGGLCTSILYGDIWPLSNGGDGLAEVNDVLCVLAANNGNPDDGPPSPNTDPLGDCGVQADNDIWPCPPNQDGLNEAGDLIAVLAASEGNPPCPDICPPCPGACCVTGPPTCVIVTLPECDALGGSFQGINTACTPNPCP
ncbi:MAG: hypothetical protein ACE5E6_06320 [Phycisphaerae bacterium]